jgi:hypothetical protein
LAHRDCVPIGDAGNILADRIVEAELSLVRQLQNGRGDEGLSQAANAHVEIGRHGFAAGGVAHPKRPDIGRRAILPDTDDGARNCRLLHPPRNRFGERRFALGWLARRLSATQKSGH